MRRVVLCYAVVVTSVEPARCRHRSRAEEMPEPLDAITDRHAK